VIRTGSIVVRVDDLSQTEFWEASLGWEATPDADYVISRTPEGNRFCVVDTNK